MARPEFPRGIVLTREIIREFRAEMDAYDRDPELYERRLREAREEFEREKSREQDYEY